MSDLQQWRDVPGYEALYQASTNGDIRSIKRKGSAGRVLRPFVDRKGYLCVDLSVQGQVRRVRVHSIVANTFLGPRLQDLQIRHLDGVKTNCALTNLAYGTASENIQDQVTHGQHHHRNKTHCPQGHEYSSENTYVNPKTGKRTCRTCSKASWRRSYATKRAVQQ